jgi:hypothetical protein
MSFDFFGNIAAQNLRGTEWMGIVEDNSDPEFIGRCKVRIFGLFDGRQDDRVDNSPYKISTGDLPWCYPGNGQFFSSSGENRGAGNLSVPKKNSVVKVRFNGGNLYSPEYFSVQDVNPDLSAEIKDSYLDSHVVLYDKDQQLKILYKPALGVQIFHKDSNITINPDSSITIEHKDTQSIIELVGGTINIVANSTINVTSNTKIQAESSESIFNGSTVTKLGPSPQYSAVLAEPLWTFLKILATAVDAKFPPTPSAMSSQAEAFEALSTSKNVKISP